MREIGLFLQKLFNRKSNKSAEELYYDMLIKQLRNKFNIPIDKIESLERIAAENITVELLQMDMPEIINYFEQNNTNTYVSGIHQLDLINNRFYTITIETSELWEDPAIIFCRVRD